MNWYQILTHSAVYSVGALGVGLDIRLQFGEVDIVRVVYRYLYIYISLCTVASIGYSLRLYRGFFPTSNLMRMVQ